MIGVARRSIFASPVGPILARTTMAMRSLLVAAALMPGPFTAMPIARGATMWPPVLRWPLRAAIDTEYRINIRSDVRVLSVASAIASARDVVMRTFLLAVAVAVMTVGTAVAFVAVFAAMSAFASLFAIPPMFTAVAAVTP